MSDRPAYRDLPGGRAWEHLDPRLGSLALLTPERVAAAAKLVEGRGTGWDFGTGAVCWLQGRPRKGVREAALLLSIEPEILERDYGCGDPSRYLREGETVLDLGSGTGKICFIAAQVVGPAGRVIGVDVTAEMIAKARSNLERLDLPQVSFQVGEAESLPFPDNDFDLVISNGVLNLTLNKEQALEEAYRVLKPGGRFMVADQVLVAELPPELANKVANWYQ